MGETLRRISVLPDAIAREVLYLVRQLQNEKDQATAMDTFMAEYDARDPKKAILSLEVLVAKKKVRGHVEHHGMTGPRRLHSGAFLRFGR